MLCGTRPMRMVAEELLDEVARKGWNVLAAHGVASCGFALPRPQELCAALNRWRA